MGLSVCVSVKSHLTYGASVRPENAVAYSAGNEGQNICGVFSEKAPLLRSSGVAVVFHTFRWPFFFIAKAVRMRIGIHSYACRTAGEYPACPTIFNNISLAYGGREVHSHFAFPVSRFSFPVSRFSFPVSRFVALIRYLEVHSYLHFPFRVSRFSFRIFRFLVHFTIVRFSFHVSRFPFSAARFAFCVSCFAFSVTLDIPYALFILSISATTTHRRPITSQCACAVSTSCGNNCMYVAEQETGFSKR